MTGTKWGAWLNVCAGLLLVVAPFALGYHADSQPAVYEAVTVGLLVGGIALWSALSTSAPAWLDYAVAALGGWSIVAPFALGYHDTVAMARNTDMLVGFAVLLIALVSHFYASSVSRQKVAA